ncbi:MAG: hypothetical protein ACLRWP_09900 [Bilophila wadsworthia]
MRERCRNDGLTMTSINSYVSKLKAAINWCVEQDLLHENPWGKYRQLPGAKNKPRTGTLEDFHKLFPVLPPWLQWAAQTAIALCLRPGISELFRLEWSAFDWKARTVCVYMPKVCTTKLVFRQRHILPKRGYGSSQTWQLEKPRLPWEKRHGSDLLHVPQVMG